MANQSVIVRQNDFEGWFALNDSIMGGSSSAVCKTSSKGLTLEGVVVEEKGGFVSCKSPIFSPTIDLSDFIGFELKIIGQGRTLKFGVSCKSNLLNPAELLLDRSPGGLRWVYEIKTKRFGTTIAKIPFNNLEPTVLAKKVKLPVNFRKNEIKQFQLLHSKFGRPGELNNGFRTGKINILIESISAYK